MVRPAKALPGNMLPEDTGAGESALLRSYHFRKCATNTPLKRGSGWAQRAALLSRSGEESLTILNFLLGESLASILHRSYLKCL